jgi:hypothetical protein
MEGAIGVEVASLSGLASAGELQLVNAPKHDFITRFDSAFENNPLPITCTQVSYRTDCLFRIVRIPSEIDLLKVILHNRGCWDRGFWIFSFINNSFGERCDACPDPVRGRFRGDNYVETSLVWICLLRECKDSFYCLMGIGGSTRWRSNSRFHIIAKVFKITLQSNRPKADLLWRGSMQDRLRSLYVSTVGYLKRLNNGL